MRPNQGVDPDLLQVSDCADQSFWPWHGWPIWEDVDIANNHERALRDTWDEASGTFTGPAQNHIHGQRGSAVNLCMPMSFIFQFCWTASDSAYLMITFDLLLNIFGSPFGSTKVRMYFYHAWIWLFALLMSTLLLISGDWGVSKDSLLEDFCWNVNFGHTSLLDGREKSNWPQFQILVYALTALFYSFSFVVAIWAWRRIKNDKLPEGVKEARLHPIKTGTKVVFVCATWLLLQWAFYYFGVIQNSDKITGSMELAAGRRDYDSRPDQTIWGLSHKVFVWMFGFFLGARNIINLIVWRIFVIPEFSEKYQELQLAPGLPTMRLAPAVTRDLIHRVMRAERDEAARNAPQGLPPTDPAEERRRRITLENMARTAPAELRTLADELGVRHDDVLEAGSNKELNEILKNELLYFIGLGMRSALRYPNFEHNEIPDGSGRFRPSRRLGGGPGRVGSRAGMPSMAASAGPQRFTNLHLEDDRQDVEIDLAKADGWEKDEKTDFSKEVSKVFGGRSDAPAPRASANGRRRVVNSRQSAQEMKANQDRQEHLQSFKFKTYAPHTFRRLREMFEIDTLGGDGKDSFLHKSMEAFKVSEFSGGASGQFMYYSADKRFIVKQVTHIEMKRMLDMLHAYVRHMDESRPVLGRGPGGEDKGPPCSLLQRVVQCHRITMYQQMEGQGKGWCFKDGCGCFRGRLYFMVIENCNYARILKQMEDKHQKKTGRAVDITSEDNKLKLELLKDVEQDDEKHQSFFVYDMKGSRVNRSTLLDRPVAMQGGDLPEGWKPAVDRNTGRTYYYKGHKAQWERPAVEMRHRAKTMKDNDLHEEIHMSGEDRDV